MNRLRTHIVRIAVIAVICTGFGLYMVQQSQVNRSSEAFASWLTTKVEGADSIALQKELDDLRKSTTQLNEFIKGASRILKTKGGNIDFSFDASKASMHFYQLLFIEWSQLQTNNTMAAIPVPSVAKALSTVVLDQKGALGSASGISLIPEYFWGTERFSADFNELFVLAMQPMTEGIAIGAP